MARQNENSWGIPKEFDAAIDSLMRKMNDEGMTIHQVLDSCSIDDAGITRESINKGMDMIKKLGMGEESEGSGYGADEEVVLSDVDEEEVRRDGWKFFNEMKHNKFSPIIAMELDILNAEPPYERMVAAGLGNCTLDYADMADIAKRKAPSVVKMSKFSFGKRLTNAKLVSNIGLLLTDLEKVIGDGSSTTPPAKPQQQQHKQPSNAKQPTKQEQPKQQQKQAKPKSDYVGLNPEDLTLLNKMGIPLTDELANEQVRA